MATSATSLLPSSLSLALLLLLLSMLSSSRASEVVVGGAANGAWRIPSSETAYTLNAWAESSRFRIGDALVFKYDAAQDSVLQVTRADYLSCSTSSPVVQYVNKDGEAKVELERSGPYYFISGALGHCEKGQKLIVVVLSPRNAYATVSSPAPAPSLASAPAPAEHEGPAVAPTSGAVRLGLKMGLALAAGSLLVVFGLGLF